ncbi:MAG: DsrE family protein [Methylococcales bacterium]|nr:DsrE family protein [Methylococcales bacterium]
MNKVAIVVLAGTEQQDSLGRIVNALMAVKELKENNDEVQLIFTGLGTTWLAELSRPEHQLHDTYQAIKENISGACGFCSTVYGVTDTIKACCIPILSDYGANMSFAKLISNGYQVITF